MVLDQNVVPAFRGLLCGRKKSKQIPKTHPVHYGFGSKCCSGVPGIALRLFGTREVGHTDARTDGRTQ